MATKQIARVFLTLVFTIISNGICFCQQLDYQAVFGNDWQKAITFLKQNDHWIKPVLEKYNIPYTEAVAVVFPELVRYSALRDKMEITLLKTLYRNLGEDYADFSVGVFQIKPSFAEKIRSEASSAMGRKAGTIFKRRSSYHDEKEFRASIISELENPQTEIYYIIAFFKLCGKKFDTNGMDEANRIKFLATAYNTGFWKSADEIETMAGKKFFNTRLFKTENYSYADVSLFWYNQYLHAR